ncbi:MAG: hypothetical protein A2Y73_06640 [Chloroflexi bacterium RBG_13_56_8]|nr:MAG: hypothetical protein A2Y73_06640 [Chloroflexi bacterium RBG_13_56_8]
MSSGVDLDLSARYLVASQLEEAIELAQGGHDARAREIFRDIIHAMPDNEDAWLWYAWLAETNEHRLRYLAEARALFPESHRIADAIRWSHEEAEASTRLHPDGSGESKGMSREQAKLDPTRLIADAGQAVQMAQRRAAQTIERVREKIPVGRLSLPHPSRELWQILKIPAYLLVAVVLVGGVVLLARHLGLGEPSVVALVLPTPNPHATPTLSPEQRISPLWNEAETSRATGNWASAVDALEGVLEIAPGDVDARKQLAQAHYDYGLELIERNELDLAQIEFDEALRLDASNEELQQVRRALRLYLDGLEASIVKDWELAVRNLTKVQKLWPDFRDTRGMLCQACFERANQLYDQDVWEDARDLLMQAQSLCNHEGVPELLAKVEDKITPPKRIEIDLSDQTVVLYENHQPIRVFITCTGRASAPTQPGRYQVLDKIPKAYGSKWDIYMPLWLGIYWAGGSENGIHALPMLKNGTIIWQDRLGNPCSYGCIVLDTPDAQFTYDWAEIGDVVFVNQ